MANFAEHSNLKEQPQTYYTQLQSIFSTILNMTANYLSVFLDYCLKPTPYDYDPHQHIKIWLSSNRDVFLTPINQLRLVNMRSINPTDTIHFIYDSRLLSPGALSELVLFCNKHKIVSHDIPVEIIPACQTREEKKLIDLYEDEIFHLHEGGNLGAASDFLRTLSPIYSLGTYTDFDVHIDTRKLPPLLKVKEPILVSFDKSTSQFCNDILIVTNPVRAFEFIQIIQRAMIDACIPNASKKSHLKPDSLKFYQVECQKKMLDDCLSLGYSIREYRNFASKIDENIESSIIKKKHIISFEELLALLNSQPAGNKKNRGVLDYGQYMTRLAVMNSTGPTLYVNAIQQYIKNNLIKTILLYRSCGFISTYKLNDYFKIQVLGSDNNDASWLPSGVNKLREQERKMDDSAKKLQTFFKKHTESKKEKDEIKIAPPSENVSKTIK